MSYNISYGKMMNVTSRMEYNVTDIPQTNNSNASLVIIGIA
jgi:hypothetical protein